MAQQREGLRSPFPGHVTLCRAQSQGAHVGGKDVETLPWALAAPFSIASPPTCQHLSRPAGDTTCQALLVPD